MKSSRRGIVLISILVLTLVATFFIGALIQMNPSRLRRTVHDENRDKAAMAAQAGVDYALNRFKSDIDWKASANEQVVDMEDLRVWEDNGNVLGFLKTEDGAWTGFRFRFNYQDGPSTAPSDRDGFNDPAHPLQTTFVSLNNLNGSSGENAPVGDGTGFSVMGPTPDGPQALHVPQNAVALLVEGIVTPGLDPTEPSTLAQAQEGTIRSLEGLYAITEVREGLDGDAVLMAGGNARFQVGDLSRGDETAWSDDLRGMLGLQSTSDNIPSIRVKGAMELERGQAGSSLPMFDPDEDSEVRTNGAHQFSTAVAGGETFTGGEEAASDAFLEITWDKVEESEDTDHITLPAGVYFFSDGDKNSGSRANGGGGYYKMNWAEYRTRKIEGTLPAPEPIPAVLLTDLELELDSAANGDRDVLKIKKDIRVTSDSSVTDLTIVPERGARQRAGTDAVTTGPSVDGEGEVEGGEVPENPTYEQAFAGLSDGIVRQIAIDGPHTSGNGGDFVLGNVLVDDGAPETDVGKITHLFQQIANRTPVELDGISFPHSRSGDAEWIDKWESAVPGADFKIVYTGDDSTPMEYRFPKQLVLTPKNPAALLGGSGGPPAPVPAGTHQPGSDDELYVPKEDPGDPDGSRGGLDQTVPQDIELQFDPPEGGSAFIRSEGDIFLGTHISGEGGGLFSKNKINLIGFGVDLEAKADNSEKDGVAIYAEQGINISTYDEKNNKYWDVDIRGTVFTKGNLEVNLGEAPLSSDSPLSDPEWGTFNYRGAIIALGQAHAIDANIGIDDGTESTDDPEGGKDPKIDYVNSAVGNANMIARGIRLFYDPSYLAPFLEHEKINPTFAPVSVSIR